MKTYLNDTRISKAIIRFKKTNILLEKQIIYSVLDSILPNPESSSGNTSDIYTVEK